MNWLSSFLTPNKSNEFKPTFGQEYLYASGYDDKHEEVHFTDNPNIREISNKTDLSINLEVITNFSEYQKICSAFGIARFELLKFIANRSNKMEEILQFFYKNINGYTLICNIYMIKQEATTDYKSKSNKVSRHISKFYLGHHVILCVPLPSPIKDVNAAKEILKSLINHTCKGQFADYFLPNSVAMIDYMDTVEKPAFEILHELNDYRFQNNISLFVELPKLDRLGNYNYTNMRAESKALPMVLKLKKLNYLMEEKFEFESKFIYGKKPMNMGERDQIAVIIVETIKKLGDLDVTTFPPPQLIVLYNHCKVYEREYCLNIYENDYVPTIYTDLEDRLDIAYRTIKNIPLKRYNNVWLLNANDENAKEIYENYLAVKWCIVMTNTTKPLMTEFLNDTLMWLLTEETRWRESVEPVLIYNGVDEYLLGMITPPPTNKHKCKDGIVFRCACDCKNDEGILKAWICTKCKFLFRTNVVKEIYCDCGNFELATLEKHCFKCAVKKKYNVLEKQKNLSQKSVEYESKDPPPAIMPITKKATPRTSASTFVTPATTPTTAAPKPIVPVKNHFNILFIGQSGAGKSMLVNSIYNYLTYNFDEVSKTKTVDCILPCQFQLQTPDFKKIVFTAGPQDENEHFNESGESVTQRPKVYKFETDKYDCKVIDTPGLGDTRGAKQDEYNLNLIRSAIIENQELHAIGFVMPSNISKLTANFEVNMRDLLSLFPKTALKNVHFFFTYANSTFFTIGDTRSSLEEFIGTFKATNNAEIPFGIENVCCVDSEAFMYFIATKQGHKYQNRDLESFRISWDKSKAAIETFLSKLNNVSPIKSDDILMTYELEQIGTMLQKEKSPVLEKLIPHILTTISQISMTSKFNLAKKPTSQPMADSQKPELFKAIELCEKHVIDPNLKQLIIKLLKEYGPKDKVIENGEQQNGTHIKAAPNENASQNNTKPPERPKRFHKEWPCVEQLKKIAEKLGKEWENGKISKNEMENVLTIQIAGNQNLENIDKKKLKESLSIIMMAVSNELAAEIEKFCENCFHTANIQ